MHGQDGAHRRSLSPLTFIKLLNLFLSKLGKENLTVHLFNGTRSTICTGGAFVSAPFFGISLNGFGCTCPHAQSKDYCATVAFDMLSSCWPEKLCQVKHAASVKTGGGESSTEYGGGGGGERVKSK